MKCPFCSNKTHIYNSRATQAESQTWRRHRCLSCLAQFTTKERIDWSGHTTIRTASSLEPYSRERLLLSLVRASQNLALPSGTLTDLCDTIELSLQKQHFFQYSTQDSSHITQQTASVLRRYDQNFALQYVNNVFGNKPPLQLMKQLLGPPGTPLDHFTST